MAVYTEENKYASSGVGTAGLTLGVIGTALASGLVNGIGNGGLFGGNIKQDQVNALMQENAILKADAATDKKLVDVYTELRKQDKSQDAIISAIDKRLGALEVSAPLREQIVLGQVQNVANSVADLSKQTASNIANVQCSLTGMINTFNAQTNSRIDCIQHTLAGITKTIVPASAVCPQPMPLYNSWEAPTT